MITCARTAKINRVLSHGCYRELQYGAKDVHYRKPTGGHIVVHRGSVTKRNGWIGQVRQVLLPSNMSVAQKQNYPEGVVEVCWMLTGVNGGRLEYVLQTYPMEWFKAHCRLVALESVTEYYLPSPFGNITSATILEQEKEPMVKEELAPTDQLPTLAGKRNFIVWCIDPKAPNPTMVHGSQGAAETEATRLAAVHGKPFYVANLVSKVGVTFKPQVTLSKM